MAAGHSRGVVRGQVRFYKRESPLLAVSICKERAEDVRGHGDPSAHWLPEQTPDRVAAEVIYWLSHCPAFLATRWIKAPHLSGSRLRKINYFRSWQAEFWVFDATGRNFDRIRAFLSSPYGQLGDLATCTESAKKSAQSLHSLKSSHATSRVCRRVESDLFSNWPNGCVHHK